MKKILLSALCVAAMALSAQAEKVVFLADDALSAFQENPVADANEIVKMPEGWYFVKPADRAPEICVEKGLNSAYVSIVDASGDDIKKQCYVTSGGLRWYKAHTLKFTPAKGVTIKNITLRAQNASYNKLMEMGDVKAVDKANGEDQLFQTLEVNKSEAFDVFMPDQTRLFYMIVETEGTPAQVATPTMATGRCITADSKVVLTCATADAKIYYTLDGTVPTTSSTEYTAPFALTDDFTMVRAIAAKDGMETSFTSFDEVALVPADTQCAAFDFSYYAGLQPKGGEAYTYETLPIINTNTNISLNNVTFVNNGIEVNMGENGGQLYRSWTFGNTVEYRPVKDGKMTFTAAEGKAIAAIYIVGSKITGIVDTEGLTKSSPINTSHKLYKPAAPVASSELTASIASDYIDQIYVYYTGGSSVAEVAVDANAAVEYFNLQGVRVANPENGLFIRRQGNNVSKVYVK